MLGDMAGTIHLVCGEDTFLVQRQARALAEAALPEAERAVGTEVIEPESATAEAIVSAVWQTREAIQTLGFFASGKLVWLRNADPLLAARPQQAKGVADAAQSLVDWLQHNPLPDGHTLLIQAQAVSRASALYKALLKTGEVHDFKVGTRAFEIENHALAQLDSLLRERNLKMSGELRQRFVDRVGTETWRLASELEKLDLFLWPERTVTEAAILDATSLGSLDAAWDLTDAVGGRNLVEAVTALRRLLQDRHNPIGLAAMLEARLRDLLIYREALDRGWLKHTAGSARRAPPRWQPVPESTARAFETFRSDPRKANAFFAGRLTEQAKSFSLRELRNARHLLLTTRERMVSTGLPPGLLLEVCLVRILAKRRPAGRRRLNPPAAD